MDDSAAIRRQIGKVTRQVARCTAAVYDLFTDYDLTLDNLQLDAVASDDLPNFTKDVNLVRSNLLRYYDRLERLHQQWQAIISTNPTEEGTFSTYIDKYGDYRHNLQQAVTILEKLDSTVDQLHHEFKKRDMPLPVPTPATSDAASHDSNYDNAKATEAISTPTFLQHQHMVNVDPAQQNPHAAPYQMFNFVDASLLSKIDLPTFSGSILDFQEFWERFSILVGDKPNIDDATKFSLLKSSLRGKALQCIQGLSITSANYRIAVDILRTHFDDKVTTRHVLYTKLANLPPCDQAGKQLQPLYNQMFALIRQFCTYEDDNKEYGLGAVLLNKFPRHIRSKIYDKTSNQTNLTPSALIRILTDIVKKESTLHEMEPQYNEYSNNNVFHVVNDPNRGTPSFRTKATNNSRKTIRCRFCMKSGHSPFNCHVYPTPKSRIEAVKKLRLCYNCLSSLHHTKNCTSKRTCSYCAKRHHTSLCLKRATGRAILPNNSTRSNREEERRPYQGRTSQDRSTSQPLTTHARRNDFHAHFNEQDNIAPDINTTTDSAIILHNADDTPRMKPLLMCAEVQLFNPLDTSKEVRATALLDTGASQSYITNELAERLQLPSSNSHEIHMYTFGSNIPLSMPANDHSIGIRCTNGSDAILNVQAIPVLTKKLKHVCIQNTGERESLTIQEATPNILIGMDYFWELVFCDDFSISPLSNRYRVMSTRIGKIVTENSLRYDQVNYFTFDDSTTTANPIKHAELLKLVERFWSNESMGILDNPNESDDEKCLQLFNDSITYNKEERRYSVKLPFKIPPSELPSNRDLAFSRFVSNLSALVLGANLLQYLRLHLDIPIDRFFLWSDSRVALAWTQSEKDLPVFIRNRVRTIKNKTQGVSIRHVPGSMNPADLASRGATMENLTSNNLWWNGPDYLLKDDNSWPADENDLISKVQQLCCTSIRHEPEITPIIDSGRFSKWTRILGCVITILTFLTQLSSKAAQHFGDTPSKLRSKATTILFRMAQMEAPPNKGLHKQLGLFKCKKSELLRVYTRIDNSALPPETKEPILLPKESNITALFILYVHEKNNHCGTEQTLIALRHCVWIPKGRSTIKRVINNRCFICKRSKARPFKLPDFPLHPSYRVNKPNYPFENAALDVMGPIRYSSPGEEPGKCWILLITCLNCRAIVVEPIQSLSSTTFLHNLRRFIATYGCPKRIMCDNAPAFKAFAQAHGEEPLRETGYSDSISSITSGLDGKMNTSPVLRERHQNSHPHPRSCLYDTPTHGEYVLIHDENHPRGTWKMGQVCGSTDDYLRSAQIRLPSKRIITRPINLISRFEIDTKPISTVQTPTVAEEREEENAPPLHPMITRSRRKRQLLQNAPVIFMILAALVAVMDAANTRCPTELTINKRIIYATPCVTNGIAVATYDDHEKHHLCWFPVTCPNGEIRPMPSYPNDSRLCGMKCECPHWSQFCLHYNGEHTQRSQISSIDPTLLDFTPKELYDGSLLLVPSLHVITKDYLDDNDFICISSQGNRLPPTPPYKGTFLFCERHQCDFAVDKFCVYDSPITLLDFDNNVTSHNTVPIKAWGTTTKEFYPHISGTDAEIISLMPNCSKGGVRIIVDRQISVVEACIQSYCIFAFNITTTDLLFPTELVVFKYTIIINAWKNGLHLYNSSITCPSHPICEILHCNICIEKAYNTQCWTTFDTTLIILLATVTISLYWIFAPIIYVPQKTHGTATHSFQIYGTTIALQPLGQEVCLSLKNQRNEPIGLISLRMLSIRHVCQRKVEFFTRDHEITTESVHRCYRMGSCKRDKCDNTKSSDIVEEFSWKAANSPGFTFCNPSCGCLLTCGCLSCQPSCLFYRYYATPTSETIYTVFTCPSWELTVTAEITLQLQQERKTFTMLLRPGRATRTGDITLSLLSTISPQLPILASAFITDGTRTAMTMKVQANELTPATPAQLQCASKLDASQFLCRFSSRACSCSAGSYKATCTCPKGHISPYLSRNTLPLITKNVIIEQHDDTIAAHTRVGSAIFLQLTMENVKIVSVQNKGQCSITSSSIEGCYSCLLGAKVSIICYSTEEQTTADITCEQEQQVAICTKTGKLNEMIFHFRSPEIATKCTVSCPGGLSSFQVEGALDYVNDAQIQDEISTKNEERIDHNENALSTVTGWIYSLPDTITGFFLDLNLFTSIKIFLTCIILIILLYCIVFVTSILSRAKKQI
ncbi:peptidase family A16 [Ostertagia ostertagi]